MLGLLGWSNGERIGPIGCATTDWRLGAADHQPQASLWETILPADLLGLPDQLATVDRLLDDPRFLAPFGNHFAPLGGRPSIPIDTYLRMMFLQHRYRLGYELLCREVADSISGQRFCRIPLGGRVPHPTTLAKLTRRVGEPLVAQLNSALLATARQAKVLPCHKVRADTTVVAAKVAYPSDLGLLARAVGKLAAPSGGSRPPVGRPAPGFGTAAGRPAAAPTRSLACCGHPPVTPSRSWSRSPPRSPTWPSRTWPMPSG